MATISYDRLRFTEGTVLGYGSDYDYLLMHVPNDNIETRALILCVPHSPQCLACHAYPHSCCRATCAATLLPRATESQLPRGSGAR